VVKRAHHLIYSNISMVSGLDLLLRQHTSSDSLLFLSILASLLLCREHHGTNFCICFNGAFSLLVNTKINPCYARIKLPRIVVL
jgi:hypothetical protein